MAIPHGAVAGGRVAANAAKWLVRKALLQGAGEWAWLMYQHKRATGRWPDLRHPRSFNEKIIRKMLRDRRPYLTLFADKVRVRGYVARQAPELKAARILWASTTAAPIRLEALPLQFVLKANHGSGWNRIVRDKNATTGAELDACGRRWLRMNYYAEYGGWCYRDVSPVIFAEEFLKGENGEIPDDYKLFVLNGHVRVIQVDRSRYGEHTQRLYSPDWRDIDGTVAAKRGEPVPPPKALHTMIAAAEKLSGGVDVVRVDLYYVDGLVYFGELTHYPNAGASPFNPPGLDYEIGEWLRLDDYASRGPWPAPTAEIGNTE